MVSLRISRELATLHLNEAGFLLFLRQAWLGDASIPWSDVLDLETRHLAHVDGVAAAGLTGETQAWAALRAEDEDSLLGAVSFFLRADVNASHLPKLFDHFVEADDERRSGFVEAMKHCGRADLESHLHPLLDHDSDALRAAVLEILGYRRRSEVAKILPLLSDGAEAVRAAAIVALDRLGDPAALSALESLPEASSLPIAGPLLASLFGLGSGKARHRAREMYEKYACPAALPGLAVAADAEDLPLLIAALDNETTRAVACQALAVFGSARAMPHLLSLLEEDEEAQGQAAAALAFITAAGLSPAESVTAPEPAELTAGEVLAAKGPPPMRKDAAAPPLAPAVVDAWYGWWEANATHFLQHDRWRFGRPFHLDRCVQELATGTASLEHRRRAYLELRYHSGRQIPFEVDWFIDRQERAIGQWRQACQVPG